ncbi:MAG: hypothetical protein R3B13_38085 [Polyangiaceae bacterium]
MTDLGGENVGEADTAEERKGRASLFSFATSELSQDAFLCWLAAVSADKDPRLARAGKRFLAWLCAAGGHGEVDPAVVQLVGPPQRQVEHIDVLLQARFADGPATFLIEDKTGTSQHSGQLERYLHLAKERYPRVMPIYFKTGYHFGEDKAAARAGYAVIGLDAWVQFLNDLDADNDILEDYRSYVSERLRERTTALEAMWTPGGHAQLRKDFAQYEFLARLQERCPPVHDSAKTKVVRGTNRGGEPWTHLGFAWFASALPNGIGETLFHRIDRRGERVYLSTRQYAQVKGNTAAKQAKLARLARYREQFVEARNEAGSRLSFATATTDRRGANESEIGVLYFNDKDNTTQAVLDEFPRIHEAFVANIVLGSE